MDLTAIPKRDLGFIIAAASLVSSSCDSPGDLLAVWTFVYDGDGVLVKQVYTQAGATLTTRLFFGRMYQMEDDGVTTTTSKYLSFGGQTVLVDGSGGLQYLLSDHLGSTVAVANGLGALVSETRYLPFGGVRTDVGAISETDLGYTGQRNIASLGLMDYRARFYDPSLKRFTQPDSIVPGAGNSQAWNRYAYVGNNPVRYNDPSGHIKNCNVITGRARLSEEDCLEAANGDSNALDYGNGGRRGPLSYDGETSLTTPPQRGGAIIVGAVIPLLLH